VTGSETKNEERGPDRLGWGVVDWGRVLSQPPDWVAGVVYAIGFLVVISLAATAAILVVRAFAPVWQGEELSSEELRNLLIAAGAVIAAPFAIWRIIISHWQARTGQEQARIARENHYTTLFTKAVEQLGAMREVKETRELPIPNTPPRVDVITRTVPNTEVRLGAIYALERIAQDSERDHWPIMETLCAYIRNNAGPAAPITQEVREFLARPSRERFSEERPEFPEMEECEPPRILRRLFRLSQAAMLRSSRLA
jgi:hypothetical protein